MLNRVAATFALIALSTAVVADTSNLQWNRIGEGKLVDAVAFQDGSLLVVMLSEDHEGTHLTFSYVSDGAKQGSSIRHGPLHGDVDPSGVVVRVCNGYAHAVMTLDWYGSHEVRRVSWRLPIEINEVHLPIVCR